MNTSKIIHREEKRIKVDFPYNQQIALSIKHINDARWSRTHRAWHIPDTAVAWAKLKSLFPEIVFEEIAIANKSVASQNSGIQMPENQDIAIPLTFIDKKKIYVEVIGKKILALTLLQ
jgi:integrase/recombinase XerD